MRIALLTPDAVGCLAQLRHAAVVAYQEGAACLGVVGVELALRHVAFVHAFVVVEQYPRNVDAIGARHAVLAVVAWDGGVFEHQLGGIEQELLFLLGERNQRRIGADVVLQMLHVGHAAQYGEHHGRCAGKAECPRSDAVFGVACLQTCYDVFGHFRQASSLQGFHDNHRNVPLGDFGIQVVGVDVSARCVLPVGIVQLDLDEIPVHLLVVCQYLVELFLASVFREMTSRGDGCVLPHVLLPDSPAVRCR